MKRNTLTLSIAFAVVVSLAACGEQQKQSDESTKEEMSDHDQMHHEGMDHDHDAMMEEAEGSDYLSVPEGAKVFFANLEDGQTVSSPLKIEFGVEGMEVEPAGELNEGKGHHHIIINGSSLERGTVVPADSLNIHYGKGQTETELELPKGTHTLTMQFADGYHQSYGEQLSATISVTVE